MGLNPLSSQSINKKKFKLLKKKRSERRNQKKVSEIARPKTKVLTKHRPSKKKMQKDAKRRRIYAEAEKAKLLKSGLITQEDIDRMEAEAGSNEDDDAADEGMEVEN